MFVHSVKSKLTVHQVLPHSTYKKIEAAPNLSVWKFQDPVEDNVTQV